MGKELMQVQFRWQNPKGSQSGASTGLTKTIMMRCKALHVVMLGSFNIAGCFSLKQPFLYPKCGSQAFLGWLDEWMAVRIDG